MANILGKQLLKCSDNYKENKENFDSFEVFFDDYLDKVALDKQGLLDKTNNFFAKEFSEIKKDSTDEEIEAILNSFRDMLIRENIVTENTNIGELIGYILLGNLLQK